MCTFATCHLQTSQDANGHYHGHQRCILRSGLWPAGCYPTFLRVQHPGVRTGQQSRTNPRIGLYGNPGFKGEGISEFGGFRSLAHYASGIAVKCQGSARNTFNIFCVANEGVGGLADGIGRCLCIFLLIELPPRNRRVITCRRCTYSDMCAKDECQQNYRRYINRNTFRLFHFCPFMLMQKEGAACAAPFYQL